MPTNADTYETCFVRSSAEATAQLLATAAGSSAYALVFSALLVDNSSSRGTSSWQHLYLHLPLALVAGLPIARLLYECVIAPLGGLVLGG